VFISLLETSKVYDLVLQFSLLLFNSIHNPLTHSLEYHFHIHILWVFKYLIFNQDGVHSQMVYSASFRKNGLIWWVEGVCEYTLEHVGKEFYSGGNIDDLLVRLSRRNVLIVVMNFSPGCWLFLTSTPQPIRCFCGSHVTDKPDNTD